MFVRNKFKMLIFVEQRLIWGSIHKYVFIYIDKEYIITPLLMFHLNEVLFYVVCFT